MSIILKIRDKYAKLAGGIIAVALVAFVLNDALSGNAGSIFGGSTQLAKVDGQKIEPLELEQRIQEYSTVYSISNQGKAITDEIKDQIQDQALKDIVNEIIVNKQLEKLGVVFTEKEQKELIYGANPSPMIMQYPVFTNPETGMFDASRIKLYEDQLKTPPEGSDPNQIEKERQNWEYYKSFVIHQARFQKFNNLIGASLYSPKYIVDYKLAQQDKIASIQVVKVLNTVIPDNEAPITDADITDYMNKHKKMFEIPEDQRNIEYISFDVVPSSEDTLNTRSVLDNIRGEFESVNNESVADFVSKYSEGSYRNFYYTKKTLQSNYADSILNKPVGTVYGPVLDQSTYMLVKVLDKKMIPDSVKAQHILIQPNQQMDDSAAHRLADSLLVLIQSGIANFDTIAKNYSVDKQNSEQGGDLGYFQYGSMVPEFNEFTSMNKIGDIKVVKTQFGYHIVKINDQKNFEEASKLAIVIKALYPSDATETDIYTKATNFAGKYKDAKGFDEGVKALNLQKREGENVKVQDYIIQGLGSARDMVRWMYNSKIGDISEVIKVSNPNNRYIIAKLASIQPKGTLKLTDAIRPQIESIVRADKKADKIIEKYKSFKTLEEIAGATNSPILKADSFTCTTPFLNNIGYEPKAIGYAFYKNNKVGVLSPGMKSAEGVTYTQLISISPKTINPNEAAVFQQQQITEQQQLSRSLSGTLQQMMMKKATIKYYNDNIR